MTSRLSRREFLKRASALSFAGAGAPFALNLATIGAASAQVTGGYRAVVCLFLFGGNDHTNTIIPYDLAEHTEYFNSRPEIALARADLAATSTAPVASQGGRSFAFHPSLTSFKSLYDAGKLAVVPNVGPLIVPTTKVQYQNRSVPLPPKLFSHNDQQSVWQANTAIGEGARLGWGGRMGDMLAAQNGLPIFTAVSAAGNAVFLSGQQVLQYQMSTSGAISIAGISGSLFGSSNASGLYRQLITRNSPHLFEDELGQITSRSIAANALLSSSLPPASQFMTPLPAGNGLASQLNIVARMIFARSSLSTNRQIFFVSLGGFDNHDELLIRHGQQLQTMNDAVGAFYSWLQEMQMENNVTLFTASDFGRTLTSNGDGSDHGWGSHHFVVGGAVQGGDVYGTFPQVAYGTNEDVRQGNLLPTTSVDQYAATFARWLGVPDSSVPDVLPNIVNFDNSPSRYLDFLV
jgi:uncharacterized protein (DUF1501 family)